ncbi:CsgG/HfaB family protein [Plesiomonas shigelloides]|uniref:Curli production assembly/transport component CsgG n=1 Tax=Plesiomonas shigelloides 302-73 TaxID=1315976 RepID=R8AVS7_PLESH|nr:CsgG/HfaB family protein [Plesiomonas shigelloides]EON90447.1 curli production assembly/transport protein CsgG [Plesiomonas shigelloides 302-73]
MRAMILIIAVLLGGCSITEVPKEAAKPTLMPRASTYKDLVALPKPNGKIIVSVYSVQDETGQFKPLPASNFSTAVPQSGNAMLTSALKDSGWFVPLEREGLQNLLNERKIIRAAQENGTVAANNQQPLPSLLSANVVIEGAIIGYDSDIKTGGAGARYFGIGADGKYRVDQVAVNLRAVDVRTGEVLLSVNTSKTILSSELSAGVFRFIEYQRLLELEAGYTTNEPVMMCMMSALEAGVAHLIVEGIRQNLWSLQNPSDINNPIIQRYMKEDVPLAI